MRARNGWLIRLLPMAIVLAFAVSPGMAQETEGPIPLEEVRVKGSAFQETPPDFPGTVNVVPKEEIERLHPAHAGEVLQRVPGVVYVDEDGRGFKPDIGFRGLNPTRSRQVLILVDGIPVQPSLYGDPGAYYNVPVQRLERVEVIKGGAALLYGANTCSVPLLSRHQRPRKSGVMGGRSPWHQAAAATGATSPSFSARRSAGVCQARA